MAEVVAISLEVDSGQSVQSVKKLEDAIKDVQNTSSTMSVEEKFNSLNTALEKNQATFGEMSQAIESYKTIALNAGRESPIGQEALKNASILKDRITDLDREVDNLAQDGQTLQGSLQIASGITAGYQAFAGITALVGDENEALMETMVKLQSTMAVLQSIEQLRMATEKESSAIKTLSNAKTKIAIGLQKAYTFAVGTGTKAMKGFKLALLATGVGAIIVALGAIVAYWDDIKGAVSGLSSEQKKRNADLEKEKELTQSNLENIDATENTLRLAGNSEQEILDIKLKQLDIQLEQQRQTIENAKVQKQTQIEAAKRNRDIAQNIIRILTLPITILLGAVDALTWAISKIPGIDIETNLEESFSGGIAEMIFDPEEVAEEGDATIAEAEKKLAELQNKRDGYTLAEQNKRKKASEKNIADKKKEDEKIAKLEEEKQAKLKELNQEFTDLENQQIEDENKRAITQLETEQKRELDALIKKYGEKTELEKQLLINQKVEMDALKEEQRLADEEKLKENQAIINGLLKQFDLDSIESTFEKARKELEIQRKADEEKLILAGATQEQINQLNKDYSNKAKKISEEETEFKKKLKQAEIKQALDASSQVLGSIISLVGEGSAVGKAAAIAQTTIDTYSGAQAAYSSVVGTPFVGPVLAPIAAGVAIASGIASIRKIVSTKVPGGGGGTGSGVTAPSFAIPSTDTSTINSQSTNGDGSGGFNLPTNRVVLVESDLRMMQERRNNSDIISTI